MVVFTNGASDRSEYRKFKLKKQQNNDLESLKEVISRRLKHSNWTFPDLIILDGGELQVSAILPLLEPLKIPVIGRDKSGDHAKSASVKIIIPEEKSDSFERGQNFRKIELSKDSHISRLIARIDEEAHRFAITYHTLLKRKRQLGR